MNTQGQHHFVTVRQDEPSVDGQPGPNVLALGPFATAQEARDLAPVCEAWLRHMGSGRQVGVTSVEPGLRMGALNRIYPGRLMLVWGTVTWLAHRGQVAPAPATPGPRLGHDPGRPERRQAARYDLGRH